MRRSVLVSSLLLLSLTLACGGGRGGSSKPSTAPTASQETPPAQTTSMDAASAETPATTSGEEAPPPPVPPEKLKADLLANEKIAYEAAAPVFAKYCASCHEKGKPKATAKKLGHFDMSSYPFGGHHAMEIADEIREVLGIGGGKATMPKDNPGAVKGDDLALVAKWADAFDAAHEGGAHDGHEVHGGHHH